MMIIQARESLRPAFGRHHPLRAYAVDSPRAKARLVVLALLADGHLDKREFDALERRGVFATLGIAREDFVEVMYDFCADVAGQLSAGADGYRLTPEMLAGLLDEVSDRKAREELLQLIFAVISSDGRLSDAEESLFFSAIEAWRSPSASDRKLFKTIPELHYG
jgi:hypothetical protein